jgi:hypothetical protein
VRRRAAEDEDEQRDVGAESSLGEKRGDAPACGALDGGFPRGLEGAIEVSRSARTAARRSSSSSCSAGESTMYNSQVTESASNIVEMRSTAHSYPAAWMLATSNEMA